MLEERSLTLKAYLLSSQRGLMTMEKNKFARLRNLEDCDRYLFIGMYCKFMRECEEMLKARFAWLHFEVHKVSLAKEGSRHAHYV